MTNTFKDELFPQQISFDGTGGPAFEGDITVSTSGVEYRNLSTEMPRWEFEVSHAARIEERWKPLQRFFVNMGGAFYSFRYWDHLDYKVASGEASFLMIDATHYQMRKAYTFGSQTFYRKITKPISGTVTGITNFVSVNYATGIVTTSGVPSGGTWQFHVHARFNIWRMQTDTVNRGHDGQYIVAWRAIPIVEVKTAG